VISEVDGEAARLTVRGHAVEELIATRVFEGFRRPPCGKATHKAAATRRRCATLGGSALLAFAPVPKLLSATRGLTLSALRVGSGMLPDSARTPHHFLVLRRHGRCSWAARLNAEEGRLRSRAGRHSSPPRSIVCA